MTKNIHPKPFDGAISTFFEQGAPTEIREAIVNANKNDILSPDYPYGKRLDKKEYENTLEDLQVELAKMQSWVAETNARVAVIFEGRDAAGKGGAIKYLREYLNPRVAKVVALSKPSEDERRQWYFQRYIQQLPSGGQIILFDRSWYNRGVVEKVFGFCSDAQRALFFDQVNQFEAMLCEDGIYFSKLWLTVGRAEQLRRFLDRESDRLRQWKLSLIDINGLSKWDEYTSAIAETLAASHSSHAPWNVIRADDKRRARLTAIRTVLAQIPYQGKDAKLVNDIDHSIIGGPELIR
jgi:polyphosphate kinase 2